MVAFQRGGVRHRFWVFPAAVSALFVLAYGHPESPAHASEGKACKPGWRVVASPAVSGAGSLSGVAAISDRDAWAVGSAGGTLIARWNGRRWQRVPPRIRGFLTAVSFASTTLGWAVGYSSQEEGKGRPLIIRWNGAGWSRYPAPDLRGAGLYDVRTLTETAAWAVGRINLPGWRNDRPLILHWDGTAWSEVRLPDLTTYYLAELYSLSIVSATDVWAVGAGNDDRPLTLHWDGLAWTIVPVPPYRPRGAQSSPAFYGVAALSPNDVWAVGEDATRPLSARWDGVRWRYVEVPLKHSRRRYYRRLDTALVALAALSSRNIWSAGFGLEHWNGARWTLKRISLDASLFGITARTASDVWAVGNRTRSSVAKPFILRYRCRG